MGSIVIHETTDPEVIVAEFEYQGTAADTGEPYALPAIFVLRVRNGEIVSSRDYHDHLASARVSGRLDQALHRPPRAICLVLSLPGAQPV